MDTRGEKKIEFLHDYIVDDLSIEYRAAKKFHKHLEHLRMSNRIVTPDAKYLIRLYISSDKEKDFINAVWHYMQIQERKEKEKLEKWGQPKFAKTTKRKYSRKRPRIRRNWHKMTRFDVEGYISTICPNNMSFQEKKKYLESKFVQRDQMVYSKGNKRVV